MGQETAFGKDSVHLLQLLSRQNLKNLGQTCFGWVDSDGHKSLGHHTAKFLFYARDRMTKHIQHFTLQCYRLSDQSIRFQY